MPVIINELVFKGTIGEAPSEKKRTPAGEAQATLDRQELVEACVEAVLKILEQQKER
jgi:hypothetical protein